ncbi:hypothetical protein NM688_g3128 [Phlebia brevispora]|uniref:Uncharacterized protein n=1 Tax=Phlebia brevispora TaxID=194682 RepID=A0ACC1T6Q0_9APHY|nr:hypothetical protein NM688_g3128 [Phlebia brevispora]
MYVPDLRSTAVGAVDAAAAAALSHPTILQTRTIRLADRTRNRLLWWDDAWAAVAFAFAIVFMTAVEMHLEDPNKHTQRVKIAVYYLCAHFFYLVAWSAKLSILFTVIRISSFGTMRRLLVGVAFIFGILYIILFAQIFWVCDKQPGWKTQPLPQCFLGRNVAIAQVICDVFSDTVLIVAPIRLVYRVHLSRSQKIRLTAIFSTTILTTVVSLNHAVWVLTAGGLKEALAAVIQTSVSLIVANLSVVVALVFRISTEDSVINTITEDAPTSIVTFGHAGANPRRKVSGVNFTTTTFMMSDDEPQLLANSIKLDEFMTPRANGGQNSVRLDKLSAVGELGELDIDKKSITSYDHHQ